MKIKVNLVNQDVINKRIYENDIIDEISKNEFFNLLQENGFDFVTLKEMFESKRITTNEQFKFNICLRKAKKEINIPMVDMVIFIEEYFAKLKKILGILDEESMSILKHELAEKHKIKIEKNGLYDLFNGD